jgi:hypothetical protein
VNLCMEFTSRPVKTCERAICSMRIAEDGASQTPQGIASVSKRWKAIASLAFRRLYLQQLFPNQ